MTGLLEKFKPYIVLLLVVILGYWQISFLSASLKWDLIDVVFPFRFYFSESIQTGYFPFWNPYLQTGTPFFADLQAPTFYPELLYTSLFTGYNIYTMHFLFVLYIFIAAAGMYQLSFYFNKSLPASLMAGLAWSFSGFIIGHGQHFFLLVGAAWIPHVVVNYLRLNQNRTFFHVLKTAVFVFLMVSGAYQALSFTLFYLLILIFLFFLIRELAEKNIKGLIELFKVNLILLVVVVIFSLPLIVSTFEIINSIDRLEQGVSLAQTVGYGQSLKSVISFLIPFSTLKYDEFFGGVDISMRNHYFGMIPLVFFIAGLFQKRPKIEYIILGFGLLIFASAFSFLPIREFMFSFVPFMNMFKYAAFIRIFGLLAFILIAANFMSEVEINFESGKKKIMVVAMLVLTGLLFLIFYSSGKISSENFNILISPKNSSEWFKNMEFYEHVLLQAIIQFIIASLFLLIIIFHKRFKYPFHLLATLFLVEILVASQMNIGFTVADNNYKPARMKNDLSLYPEKFPIPVNDKIIYNDQMHESFPPFWRNTYVFTKQISFNAFSSFELKSFNKLDDDYPNLKNAVLNNHLFYFSDKILSSKQFNDDNIEIKKNARDLYFSEDDFKILSQKTVKIDSSGTIKIVEFSPDKVTIETNSQTDQFLTMLQTNFRGWKAFVDNIETPVYTSNFNYRTIFLPKGKHTIRYEYSNNKILALYFISNFCFLIAALFLLGYKLRSGKLRGKAYVYIPLVIFLIVTSFTAKRMFYSDRNFTVTEVYKKRWPFKGTLIHQQKNFENEGTKRINETNFAGIKGFEINSETEYFTIAEISVNNKLLKEGTLVVTAKIFPEKYVEGLIVSDIAGKRNPESTWHGSKIERQIENPGKWNEIIYFRNLYDLQENEVIKVFIWNLNKVEFKVDSITVDVYPFGQRN